MIVQDTIVYKRNLSHRHTRILFYKVEFLKKGKKNNFSFVMTCDFFENWNINLVNLFQTSQTNDDFKHSFV